MNVDFDCFKLKRPSRNSKGIACLRFGGLPGEQYPRDLILALKQHWHFFWFSSWNYRLHEIPYHDLIDIYIVWDDLIEELRETGRSDYVILRGGCETFEAHDAMFYPIPYLPHDIDVLYIARFIAAKRCDVALACIHYLAERIPSFRAVFLESGGSEPETRAWIRDQVARSGLQDRLVIATVPIGAVNILVNRARLTLFTSDREGICRAVLQSLLVERPILCYRHTNALTRLFYDDRFFRYYDQQTEASVGAAALDILTKPLPGNIGARRYVLEEKQVEFHDLCSWQAKVLHAAEPLFIRDGQQLNWEDRTSGQDLTLASAWKTFKMMSSTSGCVAMDS